MKKIALNVLMMLLPGVALPALAQTTLTDQLLAQMLHRHAPAVLYEQADNPWPGGDYQLKVLKAGTPTVTSAATHIEVDLPIKVEMRGVAGSNMLQVKLNCTAAFETVSVVRLTPRKPGDVSAFNAFMTLPVPAVMANCDGMQLPVEPYIKAVVEQQKPQWEQRLARDINAMIAGQ